MYTFNAYDPDTFTLCDATPDPARREQARTVDAAGAMEQSAIQKRRDEQMHPYPPRNSGEES